VAVPGDTGQVTTTSAGRAATIRLGALTALLLLAGALPWIGAGPLSTRLIALPLLATGVLMAVATVRLRATPVHRPTGFADRPAGCATCTCGGAGCPSESAGPGARPGTMDG